MELRISEGLLNAIKAVAQAVQIDEELLTSVKSYTAEYLDFDTALILKLHQLVLMCVDGDKLSNHHFEASALAARIVNIQAVGPAEPSPALFSLTLSQDPTAVNENKLNVNLDELDIIKKARGLLDPFYLKDFEGFLNQIGVVSELKYAQLEVHQIDFQEIAESDFLKFDAYMEALLYSPENIIAGNLAAVEQSLMRMQLKGQKSDNLEQYLIACLGNPSYPVRKRAWNLLNVYYDEHGWQSQATLSIEVKFLGDSIKIDQGEYLHLHWPSQSMYCSVFLRTGGQFEYTPTQCGFYDWIAKDIKGMVVNRGRFIFKSGDVRDIQIHEASIDLIGAEIDASSGLLRKSGNFSTVQSALKEFSSSGLNWLYLPGIGQRAQSATTSPFATIDREQVSNSLGGSEAFRNLLDAAELNGIKIITDCLMRIGSVEYNRKYRQFQLFHVKESKRLELFYGCAGRALEHDETWVPNFRMREVWELIVNETLQQVTEFAIAGIMIDNANLSPYILHADTTELFRKDLDGEYHYTEDEIQYSKVVKQAFYEANYDNSPSPLLYKLTKTLWQKSHNLIIIGDMSSKSVENKNSLISSGVIPRTYEFSEKLGLAFGRRVNEHGNFENMDHSDVNQLRRWYEESQSSLHPGALSIDCLSGHHLPYPSLMYGRGIWAAADIFLILSEIPMTFLGEQDGDSYRINLANLYNQSGHCLRSVSSKDNIQQVKEATQRFLIERMSGLDINKIKSHYHNRRHVRNERQVLKTGKFVPLQAYTWETEHPDVLWFAKFTENETAVFLVNMSNHQVHGDIDLSPLREHFSSDASVISVGDFHIEAEDDLYFFDEIFTHRKQFSLSPYFSAWWTVATSDVPTKVALEKSFDRLKQQMDQWNDVSKTYLGNRIQMAVENGSTEELANILGILFSRFFKTSNTSLHKMLLLHSTIRQQYIPQFFAQTETIANCRGMENDAITACRGIFEDNRLGPIVFSTPELGKWSTAGGLGVMVDELSLGLAAIGEEVWVISPYYDKNKRGESGYLDDCFEWKANINVTIENESLEMGVFYGVYRDVNLVFLHHGDIFPKVYCEGGPKYVIKQLSTWAKASLEVCCQFSIKPAVMVTNDWFTGLVPAYAKQGFFGDYFNDTTFMHICHNLNPTYEGRIYPSSQEGTLDEVHNLPSWYLVDPAWTKPLLNPSRCAILASDQWATVSPSYKNELLGSSPLAYALREKPDAFAFNNGIPKQERYERLPFDQDHYKAKEYLQKKYFDYEALDDSVPIFGFVGRITEQKGVHLILDAVEALVHRHNHKIQIIVGGPANLNEPYSARCNHRMYELKRRFPQNFWAAPDVFFTDLALNVGADFALMPSLFEPGGIVQHEFFVGSTPVIAFKTGGLRDTVHDFDPQTVTGSGFTFESHCVSDLIQSIDRALGIYYQEDKYAQLRENAYNAVIDLTQVSRAWNCEFYRLKNKIFVDPDHVADYKSDSDKWFAEQYDPTLPKNMSESVKINRVKYTSEHKEVEFKFVFPGIKLRTVQLSGSFDKYQVRHPLTFDPIGNTWSMKYRLVPGTYHYRFLLDGTQWACNAEDRIKDTQGIYSNIKIVE